MNETNECAKIVKKKKKKPYYEAIYYIYSYKWRDRSRERAHMYMCAEAKVLHANQRNVQKKYTKKRRKRKWCRR